jgi:putative ATP-dependent endonuclease of the OLD family
LRLSRIVVRNFRTLQFVDVPIPEPSTCIIGENNTGKSSLIQALRLCVDVSLSSTYRSLTKDDVHCGVDRSKPFQVFVGVEFTGFEGDVNAEALVHGIQIGKDRARIFYRFRPKRQVREALEAGERTENSLTLDDYGWELFGGGNPAVDLASIEWSVENADFGVRLLDFNIYNPILSFSCLHCAMWKATYSRCAGLHSLA